MASRMSWAPRADRRPPRRLSSSAGMPAPDQWGRSSSTHRARCSRSPAPTPAYCRFRGTPSIPYEIKEGEKRTVYEVEVDDVGPSLRNATAKVAKATRTTAAQSGGQAQADPWATADPGGFADEPPF